MLKASTVLAAYGKQQPDGAASTTSSASSFSLEPRTWVQLAADVTDGLLDASKFRSLAVYAETKLAEALGRAAQACPSSIAGAAPEDCDDGQPLPNPLQTAVCCQLLGELAGMSGPLQPTLLKLRDALLPAIYSSCSGPSMCGRPLQFEMLPWFSLAGRLRRQNNQLLEQQAAFSSELAQHQEHMALVEQQLAGLQAALEAGTASAAALQATNATLVAERLAAVAEAAAAGEELRKVMGEVTRLTADLDDAREQLSTVKEEYGNEQEQWKAQLDALLQKLHVEATERITAVALASTEQQELEQKLWEAERKLEGAEQQLQELGSRPSNQQQAEQQQWQQQLQEAEQRHAQAVRQLQQRHEAEAAVLQRQLHLLAALAPPDPAPKPWQLNLRAEASRYFLTELEVEPTTALLDGDDDTDEPSSSSSGSQGQQRPQGAPKLHASGLGLGPDVPRFLRWDQAVEVHDATSLQQLEQQVSELWRAKAAFEAAHGPCHLQAFLHQHFWGQASSGAAAAAAAVAAMAAAAAACYQLYYACCMHQHESPAVESMWLVMTGQRSEPGPVSCDSAAAGGVPMEVPP